MSQGILPIRNNEELIQPNQSHLLLSQSNLSLNHQNQRNQLLYQNHQNQLNQSLMKTYFRTFTCLFFLNFTLLTIIYLLCVMGFIKLYDFYLCDWPIRLKMQYYRTVTHNLIHQNLLHYLYTIIFYYYVGTKLEKKIGTLMSMVMTGISIFTNSLVFIVLTKLIQMIIKSMKFKEFNMDFYNTCGYAPVSFALFYVICTFQSNLTIEYIRFNGEPVNSRYLPFLFLIIIQILKHDSSFVGHLSGILTGVIIKTIYIFFVFPSKIVLIHFEQKYRNLVQPAKEYLNYIDILSVVEIDFKEIDKKWTDFPLFEFIQNLYTKVKNRLSNNITDYRNVESANSNSNINNEGKPDSWNFDFMSDPVF